MPALIDTDIAIELRDGDAWIKRQMEHLTPPLRISAITRVELENGIQREPKWASLKQTRLDYLLTNVATLDFGADEIAAYKRILKNTGYSRRKTADQMTAATAGPQLAARHTERPRFQGHSRSQTARMDTTQQRGLSVHRLH